MVLAFECIHDMSQPVEVLAAMRAMLDDDGLVEVMDEAVGAAFTGDGDDIEKLMYGFSLLICLPDGMSKTVGRHRHRDAAIDTRVVPEGSRIHRLPTGGRGRLLQVL